MDGVASPAGTLRIGLAHGSVQGFGSAGEANVPIDPARVKSAGLSYLALGDWHGTTRISDRAWYSGTPEPDGFRDNDPGNALVVRSTARAPCRRSSAWRRRTSRGCAGSTGSTCRRRSRRSRPRSRASAAPPRAPDGAHARRPRAARRAGRNRGAARQAGAAALPSRKPTRPRCRRLSRCRRSRRVGLAGVLGDVAQRLKAAADGSGEDAAVAQRALRRLFALARRPKPRAHHEDPRHSPEGGRPLQRAGRARRPDRRARRARRSERVRQVDDPQGGEARAVREAHLQDARDSRRCARTPAARR